MNGVKIEGRRHCLQVVYIAVGAVVLARLP